jgi:hypothetical protein
MRTAQQRRSAWRLIAAFLVVVGSLGVPAGAAARAGQPGYEGRPVDVDRAAPPPASEESVAAATTAGVGAGVALLAGAAFATRLRRQGRPQRPRNRWR